MTLMMLSVPWAEQVERFRKGAPWWISAFLLVLGAVTVVPIMWPAEATRHILADEVRLAADDTAIAQGRIQAAVLQREIDVVRWKQDTMLTWMRALITMRCLQSSLHDQDLLRGLAQVDCSSYTRHQR